jgi:hypothetical protein
VIATSRTPKTRARLAARLFRVQLPVRRGSAFSIVASSRWIWSALVGLGLVALVVLTTWAVASVSAWLVPAYLSLMVLVLAAPQGKHASGVQKGSGIEKGSGSFLGERPAGHLGERFLTPFSEPDSGLFAGGATDEETSRVDSGGASAARPRRTRVRSRKMARTAAEQTAGSSSASWVRVGPGKFVRADLVDQVPGPAPTELAANINVEPAVHASEAPMHTAPAATDVEQDAPASPEPTPGELGDAPASDPVDPGPVTEEYGIAPSAFGPTPVDRPRRVRRVACGARRLVSACASMRRASSGRVAWHVARGVRGRFSGRTLRRVVEGSLVRSDLRLRQAARRAYGRTTRVQRAWRPRSPPEHPGPLPSSSAPRVASLRVEKETAGAVATCELRRYACSPTPA